MAQPRARHASPLRQNIEVLLDVPVGHGGAEALPLVALVVHEHGVHLAGHCLLDHLVGLEGAIPRLESGFGNITDINGDDSSSTRRYKKIQP